MSKIALIGLDGSGKSANLNLLKEDKDFSNCDFLWVRWKPFIVKPLYKIINKKTKNLNNENGRKSLDSEYNNKKEKKKKLFKSPVVKKIWLVIATIDYWLQFQIKTFKYIFKKNEIIFDRFYIDLYVDQCINFDYSPEKIYKEIKKHQWLFPNIDKYIYIKVSPKICYDRKDDIPNLEYLQKRYDIYEYISKKDNWIVVNGEKSLEEVFNDIKIAIRGEKNG